MKIVKVIAIILFTFLLNIIFSCIDALDTTVEITDFHVELFDEANNVYLIQNDTCKYSDLKISIDLVETDVTNLSFSGFTNNCFALEINSYFYFTNKLEDIKVYIKKQTQDSVEITDLCTFYYKEVEYQNTIEIAEKCNEQMVYYSTHSDSAPYINFEFKLNSDLSDTVSLKIVIDLILDNATLSNSTPYLLLTQ